MLSKFWGYLPYLFKEYGIIFKIIKGIWDTGTLLPGPHCHDSNNGGVRALTIETIVALPTVSVPPQ